MSQPPKHATVESAAAAVGGEDRDRKAEHIRLALEPRMQFDRRSLDGWTFDHVALPEIDLEDVDTGVEFVGRTLTAPILISCMTGGTDEATRINRNLAVGAEAIGIAVGVGSQRKAIEDDRTAESFRIRPFAPSVPILANLGAVQLNYGYGVDECRRAVDMIDADALTLHLNPLQEAIQPEGQTRFGGLLPKIEEVVRSLDVPVVAKEVGSGLSRPVGERLVAAGVTVLDTAGTGGTSWARIEAARANDLEFGERFAGWGIATADSIRALRGLPGATLIASGGVRDGIDVAKSIALGADVVGLAYPFLTAAVDSPERVEALGRRVIRELRICMFCLGVRSIRELQQVPVRRIGEGE